MTLNEINLAELLKDCPKGMELYSTIYGPVYFEGVKDTGNVVLIYVKTVCNTEVVFYPDGRFNVYYSDSEMTLFPSKDVRTWEGFIPPCNFKDGDIVATTNGLWIGITKGGENGCLIPTYCVLKFDIEFEAYFNEWEFSRFATEEEKQKLFDAIKDNGYKWNAETKTLEKLIEPRFKVGDKIRQKNHHEVCLISEMCDNHYLLDEKDVALPFFAQDQWELVPNKFDIANMKPFESRVLVRDDNGEIWRASFWGCLLEDREEFKYDTIRGNYAQCIPYEGNEHLLGKTDECDDYYKNWE